MMKKQERRVISKKQKSKNLERKKRWFLYFGCARPVVIVNYISKRPPTACYTADHSASQSPSRLQARDETGVISTGGTKTYEEPGTNIYGEE